MKKFRPNTKRLDSSIQLLTFKPFNFNKSNFKTKRNGLKENKRRINNLFNGKNVVTKKTKGIQNEDTKMHKINTGKLYIIKTKKKQKKILLNSFQRRNFIYDKKLHHNGKFHRAGLLYYISKLNYRQRLSKT